MKAAIRSFTSHLVTGLALCVCQASLAQAPSGVFATHVGNPTNSIWDFSAVTDLKDISLEFDDDEIQVHIEFDIDFVQNGSGKLAGTSNTTVFLAVDGPQPSFPAVYKMKGAVKSSKGIASLNTSVSVTGTAQVDGITRKVTASETITVVVDSINRHIVSGKFSQKASASGLGSIKESGPVDSQPLPPELGDGSWDLSMDITPDEKGKYTGTATVTLSTGKVYPYTVTGTYSEKQGRTSLLLKGADQAKGSMLKVTMTGSDIQSITGKISGQSVVVQ